MLVCMHKKDGDGGDNKSNDDMIVYCSLFNVLSVYIYISIVSIQYYILAIPFVPTDFLLSLMINHLAFMKKFWQGK